MKHVAALSLLLLLIVSSPMTANSAFSWAVEHAEAAMLGDEDVRLRARPRAGIIKGQGRYREKDRGNRGIERRFKAKLERAQPFKHYRVLLNGQRIGMIRTNAIGRGVFKLKTARFIDGDDRDWRPMPDDFPTVRPGDSLTIGNAIDSFRVQ